MGRSNVVCSTSSAGDFPQRINTILRSDSTDAEQNANRDYSGADQEFSYTAAGKASRISRLIVVIGDVGTITPVTYGAIAALDPGLLVEIHRESGGVEDLLDGLPILKNMDWQRYSYDVVINDQGAGNAGFIGCRWTFSKASYPLRLGVGDKFVITCRDNLSGLTDHYFAIQGYVEDSRLV